MNYRFPPVSKAETPGFKQMKIDEEEL